MRIIGGNDYYDSAMAFGHDPAITYIRGDRTLDYTAIRPSLGLSLPVFELNWQVKGSNPRRPEQSKYRFRAEHLFAVLAGKLYAGVYVDVESSAMHDPSRGIDIDPLVGPQFLWTYEAFQAWLDTHNLERTQSRFSRYDFEYSRGHPFQPVPAPSFFGCHPLPPEVISKLVSERITILSHGPYDGRYGNREGYFRVDQPSLKDLQFYRVLPAAIAFQEVEMWTSGVLGSSAPNTVKITDDKVKIAKHGFDTTTSFRKAKGS